MDYWFLILLFVIAFLYSSVGHGGASGYLALMAFFSICPEYMRSSALILNLFVAGSSFISYYRGGFFKWKILFPFAIASVPMSFIGAQINIDPKIYKIALGICLLIAVMRMMLTPGDFKSSGKPNLIIALFTGALVGFFSGMIGIGGGIILSPLLLLLHWANVKEAAAISALFILLNSTAGLIGLWQAGLELNPDIFTWIIVAFFGGILGSWNGSFRFSILKVQYILAGVLILASLKLFLT